MDGDTLRSLIATLLRAFPDAIAVQHPPAPPICCCSAPAMPVLALPPGFTPLSGGAALRAWTAGAPLNTDDSARVEYHIADHLLAGDGQPIDALLRGLR